MSKLKDFFKSGHIQVALATGVSIVALAYFSKRVLPEPIKKMYLGGPPFLMVIYQSLVGHKKYKNWTKSVYWVIAILLATALIIFLHWI